MSSVVVIGAQWGDEGKGKVVDYLAQKADAVVRYSGGSNAGHTVVVNDVAYKLRLLPSGILYHGKVCILGNGVVINPGVVLQEIKEMHEKGVDISRIAISDRAHGWFCPIINCWMRCRKKRWAVPGSVPPKAGSVPAIWIKWPV